MKRKLAVVALSATATFVGLTGADATQPHHDPAYATPALETVAAATDVPSVAVPDDVAPPVGSDLVVEATPPKAQAEKDGPDVVQVAHQRRETELEAAREEAAAASRATAERKALEDAWTHPAPNAHVTSPYGWRAPIAMLGMGSSMHSGTDLAAPRGTPIRTAAAGTVTYVGYGHPTKHLTGWVVVVSHDDATETSYNHMDDGGILVEVGQQVEAGQDIARVGSSGNSTGPHVHLSVWINDAHTDPEAFFAQRGAPLR